MKAQSLYRIIGLNILFISFISFPLVNYDQWLLNDTENSENRALAKKPELNVNHLDPFPQIYESYYNDHFTIRSRMIKWFTYFNLRFYKKSPFPERVVIGNDNWLYTAGDIFNCYLGTNRFTDDQLLAYKKDLELQRDYLAKRGCKFYFVVTPTKATIHTKAIPHTWYRFNTESPGEQLTNYLLNNSDLNVIDLYKPLRRQSSQQQLYYKHDNHWNPHGAFLAAGTVSGRIAKDFPTVQPLSENEFTINQIPRHSGDIVYLLGNPDFYEGTDTDFEFIDKRTGKTVDFSHVDYAKYNNEPQLMHEDMKQSKRPKLYLISDSFSYLFYPFIARSFGESVNVFDLWNYKLRPELIEKEKPDVYLVMTNEAFVLKVPDNSCILAGDTLAGK